MAAEGGRRERAGQRGVCLRLLAVAGRLFGVREVRPRRLSEALE